MSGRAEVVFAVAAFCEFAERQASNSRQLKKLCQNMQTASSAQQCTSHRPNSLCLTRDAEVEALKGKRKGPAPAKDVANGGALHHHDACRCGRYLRGLSAGCLLQDLRRAAQPINQRSLACILVCLGWSFPQISNRAGGTGSSRRW